MLFKVLKNATFLKRVTAEHMAVNNAIGIVRSVTERTQSDPGHFIAIFWSQHISVYTLRLSVSVTTTDSLHILSTC